LLVTMKSGKHMTSKGMPGSSAGRGRACARLLLILLAIASAGGYWFLGVKIEDGERQYADGQRQLADSIPALAAGKDKLEAGQQRLSEGKDDYRKARRNRLLVWADKLFKGGRGFETASARIAQAEQQIADGEERIRAGERRAADGQHLLRRGSQRLRMAGVARVTCAAGACLFAAVAIVLGQQWK
jgi:hypothetical protein